MESDSKDKSLAVTRCNGVPITLWSSSMKTYTTKIMGKTVAVYGKRARVIRNRFGVSLGSTFMGLHLGKTSRYLSVPAFAKRTFGGVKDIQKVY